MHEIQVSGKTESACGCSSRLIGGRCFGITSKMTSPGVFISLSIDWLLFLAATRMVSSCLSDRRSDRQLGLFVTGVPTDLGGTPGGVGRSSLKDCLQRHHRWISSSHPVRAPRANPSASTTCHRGCKYSRTDALNQRLHQKFSRGI